MKTLIIAIRNNASTLLATLLVTIAFFLVWPTNLIHDDAAIILKYMENFSNGYFFRYNASDTAVFGVSGFLHGLICGICCYLQLLTPLYSLFFSNFIGFFGTAYLSLKIIQHYLTTSGWRYPIWLGLIFSAPHFVANIKTGMETPLHLTVLLLVFWFYLQDNAGCMWLSGALAIISKLDALPVVMTIWLFWVLRRCFCQRKFDKKDGLQFLLYGIVPLVLWCVFTFLVFDGPFPQTAKAKLFYFPHPSFFSFIKKFHIFLLPIISLLVMLWFYIKDCFASQKADFTELVYSVAAVAMVFLYIAYNPFETHSWYYAIPEFLVMLQLVVFSIYFYQQKKNPLFPLCFLLIALSLFPFVFKQIHYTLATFERIEKERIAVGRWIDTHSAAGDTLLAGHGHIAYHSQLYTVDYSGLNSTISTEFNLDMAKLIDTLNPHILALPGLIKTESASLPSYKLIRSFYNIALSGKHPAWRIFSRCHQHYQYRYIDTNRIEPAGTVTTPQKHRIVAGDAFLFKNMGKTDKRLIFGMEKSATKLLITISILKNDQSQNLRSYGVQAANPQNPVLGKTRNVILDLPQKNTYDLLVKVRDAKTGNPVVVRIINPVIERMHLPDKGRGN